MLKHSIIHNSQNMIEIRNWIGYAVEQRLSNVQIAVVARRLDRVRRLVSDGYPLMCPHNQHSLMDLAQLTSTERGLPHSAACNDMMLLIRSISRVMSVGNVGLFHARYKNATLIGLIVQTRLRKQASIASSITVIPCSGDVGCDCWVCQQVSDPI